jgi:cell division protease FtsH
MQSHVTYSDQTASIIDQEVKDIVAGGLERARELLKNNVQLLHNMARLLVERETIFSEEVDMLMEGKSVEEIIEFMDNNEHTLSENPFARKASVEKKEETAKVTVEEPEVKEVKEETAGEKTSENDKPKE